MMIYKIRVKGHLNQHWSAWFDGMTITNEANGDSISIQLELNVDLGLARRD